MLQIIVGGFIIAAINIPGFLPAVAAALIIGGIMKLPAWLGSGSFGLIKGALACFLLYWLVRFWAVVFAAAKAGLAAQ